MQAIELIHKQSRPVILASGLLLVFLLGVTDYVTGPELFFLEFYLLPVLLVAWFAGEYAGVAVSAASALCWFIDEAVGRSPSQAPAIPYWNVAIKFVVFVLFTHMVIAFKQALERQKQAEQEKLQHEIEIARQVQLRFFPQSLPPMKTLDYTGICKPALGVGGDYYDFIQLGPDKLGIAIGDVSGKGLSSALLMASLQGMLRSHAFQRAEAVAELISDMNQLLCASSDQNRYATFFYGLYNDSTRCLTYVNAGHNPPIIIRPSQNSSETLRLEEGGLVIGLFKNASYQKAGVQLSKGDVLLLFTDGVSEAMNVRGEEFTEDRLVSLVRGNVQLSAVSLRDLILEQVNSFAGQAPQHDDLTLVVVKVQ